jgi:hypothetical protein
VAQGRPKPTELTITLAALATTRDGHGWLYAVEIARNLNLLGFDIDSRRLAPTLSRMATVDMPWLDRRRSPFGDYEYRVTQWGRTDIHNRLPALARRV